MNKSQVKENEFSGAPGGTNGTDNYQTGYGTFGSPDVSQNPNLFANSNNNKAVNQNSNTVKDAPNKVSTDQQVNALFSKKETPTPDEIVTGIKYELGQQIKKDKAMAKDTVLKNLRKDPKFYTGLKMMNITDKDMVDNMTENKNPNSQGDLQVYNKLKELGEIKVGDYIGLRLMRSQLVDSLCRLKSEGKINFDGTVASIKSVNESKHPNDSPERIKITANPEATKQIFADLAKGHDEKYVVNSQICDVMKEMWAAKHARRLNK